MKLNLPNKITLSRIFLIPFIIFCYLAEFMPFGKLIALVLFVIAACTDFVDGYIARKNNQITSLGKFLDPMADKLLTMAALFLVVADQTVIAPYGVIFASIIIAREFLVSGLRQIAATKNVVMAADWFGKIKTIVQDIALPFYILLAFLNTLTGVSQTLLFSIEIIAFTLLAISVALTIFSGVNYFVKNKEVLK